MLPNNLTGNQADAIAQMKGSFARYQLVFGAVFTLAALAFGIFAVIRPALQIRAARKWTQTPCVIAQSSVVRGTSGSGTRTTATYSLSLAYPYQVQGRSYRGTTYSFDATQLSGAEKSRQGATQLPVGAATVCWVNPARPDESVLKRDAQQPRLLLRVPVILLAAGLATFLNALKTLRAENQ